MKREEMIWLAVKAGFDEVHECGLSGVNFLLSIGNERCTFEVMKLINLVEQATLERAAKVLDHCVAVSGALLASANEYHDEDAAIEISCERAAYADSAKRIRALKDPHD